MGIAYNNSVVRDGLVLHLDAANPKSYPGSGTTWFDLSGNKNDMSLVNGPVFSSDLKGSLGFDSTNDYIQGNSTTPFQTTSFTIEMYLKLTEDLDSSKFKGFFSTIQGSSGYQLFWHSAQYFYLFVGGIVASTSSSAGTINSGQFLHLVATYDNGNTNNSALYVNQQKYQSTTSGNYVQSNLPPRIIGLRADSSTNYHVGCDLYSVKFYNRSLTDLEINRNFNSLRDRYGI